MDLLTRRECIVLMSTATMVAGDLAKESGITTEEGLNNDPEIVEILDVCEKLIKMRDDGRN